MRRCIDRRVLVALLAGTLLALALSACGAGPYGFSKYYIASELEDPYNKQARDYNYGIVAAKPAEFQGQLIAWFGIVQSVTLTQDGRFLVRMSHNKHRERHLCESDTSSSCRVTVHFKSSGGFSTLINLEPKDMIPSLDKIQPGTLLRVFGRVMCKPDEDGKDQCEFDKQGGVLLDGVFYRQWPARYYVTTRAMSTMRR